MKRTPKPMKRPYTRKPTSDLTPMLAPDVRQAGFRLTTRYHREYLTLRDNPIDNWPTDTLSVAQIDRLCRLYLHPSPPS